MSFQRVVKKIQSWPSWARTIENLYKMLLPLSVERQHKVRAILGHIFYIFERMPSSRVAHVTQNQYDCNAHSIKLVRQCGQTVCSKSRPILAKCPKRLKICSIFTKKWRNKLAKFLHEIAQKVETNFGKFYQKAKMSPNIVTLIPTLNASFSVS